MMHDRDLHRTGRQKDVREIVIPPSIIANTRTATLTKALHLRAGHLLLPQGAGLRAVIICSGSAKSMLKLARGIAFFADADTAVVHSFCSMHMLWASIMSMLSMYGLVNGICCATCLLHKARNRRHLRRKLFAHLKPRGGNLGLKFRYGRPNPADIEHNETVMQLLMFADDPSVTLLEYDGEDERRRAETARADVRRRFLKFFNARWAPYAQLEHICEVGCNCGGPRDAWKYAGKLIWDAFASQSPKVPALNKWNKLFHPLAWWSFAWLFNKVVVRLFCEIAKPEQDGLDDWSDTDIHGVGTAETYQKAQRARFRTDSSNCVCS